MRSVSITPLGLALLYEHPLTKAETRILWYLVHTLPAAGAPVSHIALAKEISIGHVKIGKALKRFADIGLIKQAPRSGLNHHYTLNPSLFIIAEASK